MLISDWSSDVCSSDLLARTPARVAARSFEPRWARRAAIVLSAAVPPIAEPSAELDSCRVCSPRFLAAATESLTKETGSKSRRSEERRVGKECVSTCRSRWSPSHYKKTKNTKNKKPMNHTHYKNRKKKT